MPTSATTDAIGPDTPIAAATKRGVEITVRTKRGRGNRAGRGRNVPDGVADNVDASLGPVVPVTDGGNVGLNVSDGVVVYVAVGRGSSVRLAVTDGVGVGHTPGNTAGRSTETDGTTTAGLSNGETMHELTNVVVPVMVAPLTTTDPSVTVVPEMVDSAQTPASCRTCN